MKKQGTALEYGKIERLIREWAEQNPFFAKVYIYGSRTREDYKPDSDLDIAIVLDPEEFHKDGDVGDGTATWNCESDKWKKDLEELFPGKILHMEKLDADTPRVIAGVKRSSILVFEKKPKQNCQEHSIS